MGTLSSILCWRIPWTEEPGRLQVHTVAKSWKQLKPAEHTHSRVIIHLAAKPSALTQPVKHVFICAARGGTQ